jgi:hypothetical protein
MTEDYMESENNTLVELKRDNNALTEMVKEKTELKSLKSGELKDHNNKIEKFIQKNKIKAVLSCEEFLEVFEAEEEEKVIQESLSFGELLGKLASSKEDELNKEGKNYLTDNMLIYYFASCFSERNQEEKVKIII